MSSNSPTNKKKKECITMAKMYYEKDCELSYLNGKKIAIIGYGSQGLSLIHISEPTRH